MTRGGEQPKLFDTAQQLPNGFIYRPDFLTGAEEDVLLAYIDNVGMRHPVFAQGYDGRGARLEEYAAKRRIIGYGWGYDFKHERFIPGPPLPRFLQPLQRKVAKWLDIAPARVAEALINDYSPGAGIGWHRDREAFEVIVGISLASWCRMRVRPLERIRDKKSIVSIDLEPRSAYIMQGPVRSAWQHSVAPVTARRVSITLRTLPQKLTGRFLSDTN